jgi:large subunit ribosomal protein L31e
MAEEKIYTIPLGSVKKKSRRKRTPYAVKIVKDYLSKHTKTKEIKIGKRLNEEIWKRGIKKPPTRVRIKAVKDGDIVKAELIGFEYEEFKAKPKTERKGVKERLMERLGPKAMKKEEEEKKIEGKGKEIPTREKIEKHEIEKK